MKKKVVLFAIIICMIAVIVMAFMKKNDVFKIEKDRNRENKSTLHSTSDKDIKKIEDIPVYNMGEKAHCGSKLSNSEGELEVYTFDYVVEEVMISDKVDNIPDYLTDDDLRFINSDGYPIEEYGKDHKFINIKLKIINNSKTAITTYINCMKLVDGSKMEYIDSSMVCYSDFERYKQKDYYGITLDSDGEFETVVYIAVKESDIPEHLLLLINPDGIDYVYNGAVMINLSE